MTALDQSLAAALKKRIEEERQGSLRSMLIGLPHEKYLYSCGYVQALTVLDDAIDELIAQIQRG